VGVAAARCEEGIAAGFVVDKTGGMMHHEELASVVQNSRDTYTTTDGSVVDFFCLERIERWDRTNSPCRCFPTG
jgi:hypothetical protein